MTDLIKNNMKIVILDGKFVNPGDLSWDELREIGDTIIYDTTSAEDVVKRAYDADIVITNKVVFDAATIDSLPNLKYIGVSATGYNIVDVRHAAEKGIIVTNIPAYSTESVVQMVFAHILNITNRVGYYADENRSGRWSKNDGFCYWDTPLIELDSKTIGIVGLGNIGKRTAEVAHAFGMRVVALTSKETSALPPYINKADDIDYLLSQSDIVTLHCPLTEETKEIINSDSINKMKKGAILINTGRGGLINEHDVAEALKKEILAWYGTDVLTDEPPLEDSPLLTCKNAFITPHIAWATLEARKRLMNILVDNVRKFISDKPQNIVKP